MATVRIPPALRPTVGGRQVEVDGPTVGEVLKKLGGSYPAVRDQIFDDTGDLRRFINVYLNDRDVQYLDRLETPVGPTDTITILPAMAGGAVIASPTTDPPPTSGSPGRSSILAAIGNTPVVELHRLRPPGSTLFVKLEGMNPSGSVKDRPALFMLEAAERRGELRPGQVLLEPTSGNTGLALAMIARVKGYRLRVVAPESVPREKLESLKLFGAEIVFSPGEAGSNGAIEVAHEVDVACREVWMLDQYANPANAEAHYQTTAPEVLGDVPTVTAFVAGLGSGGTLMGVSKRLKEHDPAIDVIAAEPAPGDQVQGLRSLAEGFVPPIFNPVRLNGRYLVDSSTALDMTRRLIREEGIFAGPSSGAALVAAFRYAEDHPGSTIVTLLADGGWKYLSTGMFDETKGPDRLEQSILW